MRKTITVRADADEDKSKRAKEIEDAVKRADAEAQAEKQAREKADAEMKSGVAKIADSVAKLCDSFGEFGKRLDAIEERIAGGDEDGILGDAEERAKARADQKILADAIKRRPHFDSNEDRVARADAQARCDSVACAFGEQAPPPMAGESPIEYRRRLLKPFQRHSKDFAKIDLDKIDATTLPGIEARIFADALAASKERPEIVNGDQLYMSTRRDESGHTINEYHGRPSAWMDQFSSSRQRATGEWKIGGSGLRG